MTKEVKKVSYLKVNEDSSELVYEGGSTIAFKEGKPNSDAIARLAKIKAGFKNGFLDRSLKKSETFKSSKLLTSEIKTVCDELVDGVSQELGRALMGISILQMAIKAIEPSQSIRLHKGGSGDFSWVDGISMRTLDSSFLIPFLRSNSLLSINSYGVFMTRGLAENYPYSKVYKAALRGPKKSWLEVVEFLELQPDGAEDLLLYSLSRLRARSNNFDEVVIATEKILQKWVKTKPKMNQAESLIENFLDGSPNAARLLEVCIHSMLFTLGDKYLSDLYLKPMTQMRSANKKAKNIGDIELSEDSAGGQIIESWDAKYGTHYYLDELDFLIEKLSVHPECKRAGFITEADYEPDDETIQKIEYIKEAFGVEVLIFGLSDWLDYVFQKSKVNKDQIAANWVQNIHAYLSLRLREVAPLDEPTEKWLLALQEVMGSR
jgi:hypothetical protein